MGPGRVAFVEAMLNFRRRLLLACYVVADLGVVDQRDDRCAAALQEVVISTLDQLDTRRDLRAAEIERPRWGRGGEYRKWFAGAV